MRGDVAVAGRSGRRFLRPVRGGTIRIYYNTNGFAHHRLNALVDLLADLGYDGIALTPDVQHLDPDLSTPAEIEAFRSQLDRRGLGLTLESGARYLLDARRKHYPTLLSSVGFARRQALLTRLIDLAAELGSPLLSIWSGAKEPDTPAGDAALDLLAERLKPVIERAAERGVLLCFEPEPGMLVETIAQYTALCERLVGQTLWLTIDTGHLAARESPPYHEHLLHSGSRLKNVHLDDASVGEHEHRFFGEGDLDFKALFAALRRIEFEGPVAVELSRHSHLAPHVARQAIDVLRAL